MNRRTMILMGTLSLITFANSYVFGEDEHEEQQALIKAIRAPRSPCGKVWPPPKPGPADFWQVRGRRRQAPTSVYTSKDGKFSEVLVDYATGKITNPSRSRKATIWPTQNRRVPQWQRQRPR